MNRPEAPEIPDVQSHADVRELAIDRVGIRGLRYPMRFADGNGELLSTIASCNVYVALPAERKGTHPADALLLKLRQALLGQQLRLLRIALRYKE